MNINELSRTQKIGAAFLGGVLLITIAFGVGALVAGAKTIESFPQEFFIAGVDVSGKKTSDAQLLVQQRVRELESGVTVYVRGYGNHKIPVGRNLIDFDETMQSAKSAAQRGAVIKRLKDLLGFTQRIEVALEVTDAAENIVSEDLIKSWNAPLTLATNASFKIENGVVSVVPGSNGQTIDIEKLEEDFLEALMAGNTKIDAAVIEDEPEITTEEARGLESQAAALASEITRGRTLSIKNKTFPLSSAQIIELLQPRVADGDVVVSIDSENLKKVLGENLTSFEQSPKNPEFERKGDRVTKFVPPTAGLTIDWDLLSTNIFNSLSTSSSTIAIPTKETEPETPLSSLNDLGISEMIGFGTSDFSGSSRDRIHNIQTGMNAINGTLIAPGEIFSLVGKLSPIDGSTGYLQELVIKGDRTIPEYGGGLCQIGTTTFRAAMGAGFEIVERRNHSYQVSYYFENGVSGTDATIYEPNPDFRFKNDTAHWVMLETVMHSKGSILEFRFWGTSDGRKATRTIPKTLTTTPPPPRRLIETTDLPPGKMKCTEKARSGATMNFTYTVAYADGKIKNQDFPSYYKPWGEVCLIGVAPSSTPTGMPEELVQPIVGPLTSDSAGVSGE